jgi:hypothetical protein
VLSRTDIVEDKPLRARCSSQPVILIFYSSYTILSIIVAELWYASTTEYVFYTSIITPINSLNLFLLASTVPSSGKPYAVNSAEYWLPVYR